MICRIRNSGRVAVLCDSLKDSLRVNVLSLWGKYRQLNKVGMKKKYLYIVACALGALSVRSLTTFVRAKTPLAPMNLLLLISVVCATAFSVCAADDPYSIAKTPSHLTIVKREVATESGDWVFNFTYTYGKNGQLKSMTSEFFTFNGLEQETEQALPTVCVRRYEVSETKQLILKSQRITDSKTKKVVQRSFWEPEVHHWMSLSELPKK